MAGFVKGQTWGVFKQTAWGDSASGERRLTIIDCQLTPARTGGPSVSPAQTVPEKPPVTGPCVLSVATLRIQQAQLKLTTPIPMALITLAPDDRFRPDEGAGMVICSGGKPASF